MKENAIVLSTGCFKTNKHHSFSQMEATRIVILTLALSCVKIIPEVVCMHT